MLETLFIIGCGFALGLCSYFPIAWTARKAVDWYHDQPRQHHKRCLRNIERLEIELGLREAPDKHAPGGIWQINRPKNFHQLVKMQRQYESIDPYQRALYWLEHGKRKNGQ